MSCLLLRCARPAAATAAVVAGRRPVAETIYSNNGPRVIREAIAFQFCHASRAFPRALQVCARATLPPPTHARPTAFVYDRRRTSLALQEQARPSKPSAPPSEQAHHPAAHASPHGAPQLSHVQMCTQLTCLPFPRLPQCCFGLVVLVTHGYLHHGILSQHRNQYQSIRV